MIKKTFKKIISLIERNKSLERSSHIRLIKKYEFSSYAKCLELQKKLLFEILKFSTENVQYYKEIVKNKKIKISEVTVFEDIKKFPILDKEIIRRNYLKLRAKNLKIDFIKNTSGGSTGEPIVILQDSSFKEKSKATKLFFDSLVGRGLGEKMIRLWGSEKEILEGSSGIQGWIDENICNVKILNAFRRSDKKMEEYVNIINLEQPSIIEAYVQSIYELAKFIEKNNLKIYHSKGIITSAGILSPEIKKFLKRIFKTKIYDQYGSREVGLMAYSCNKDIGLHTNTFDQYIEILNDHLKPCKPGEIGYVYVTNLNNKIMPLIRYKIGDMAIPSKNQVCSCGRPMPLIEKVVGRTINLFKNSKGELIDGEYFTHLFYFKPWVKKFQVTQKSHNLIVCKVVLGEKRNKKEIKNIEDKIKLVMGKKCIIKWKFVQDIPPTKSGKFLYTISEVK